MTGWIIAYDPVCVSIDMDCLTRFPTFDVVGVFLVDVRAIITTYASFCLYLLIMNYFTA